MTTLSKGNAFDPLVGETISQEDEKRDVITKLVAVRRGMEDRDTSGMMLDRILGCLDNVHAVRANDYGTPDLRTKIKGVLRASAVMPQRDFGSLLAYHLRTEVVEALTKGASTITRHLSARDRHRGNLLLLRLKHSEEIRHKDIWQGHFEKIQSQIIEAQSDLEGLNEKRNSLETKISELQKSKVAEQNKIKSDMDKTIVKIKERMQKFEKDLGVSIDGILVDLRKLDSLLKQVKGAVGELSISTADRDLSASLTKFAQERLGEMRRAVVDMIRLAEFRAQVDRVFGKITMDGHVAEMARRDAVTKGDGAGSSHYGPMTVEINRIKNALKLFDDGCRATTKYRDLDRDKHYIEGDLRGAIDAIPRFLEAVCREASEKRGHAERDIADRKSRADSASNGLTAAFRKIDVAVSQLKNKKILDKEMELLLKGLPPDLSKLLKLVEDLGKSSGELDFITSRAIPEIEKRIESSESECTMVREEIVACEGRIRELEGGLGLGQEVIADRLGQIERLHFGRVELDSESAERATLIEEFDALNREELALKELAPLARSIHQVLPLFYLTDPGLSLFQTRFHTEEFAAVPAGTENTSMPMSSTPFRSGPRAPSSGPGKVPD